MNIDQFFVDMFGGFGAQVRMLVVVWLLLGGAYALARTPRNKRLTVKDHQDSTKTFLIFFVLWLMATTIIILSYFLS